jgi:hypothetical protein
MNVGDRVAYSVGYVRDLNPDELRFKLRKRGVITGFQDSQLYAGQMAANIRWDDSGATTIVTMHLRLEKEVHLEELT